MSRKQKFIKVTTATVVVVTLLCALYIMGHGLGLVDSLDFGVGAYYYADIPEFEKYIREDSYSTAVPLWACILLFLGWGYLMWRLWCRIDRK